MGRVVLEELGHQTGKGPDPHSVCVPGSHGRFLTRGESAESRASGGLICLRWMEGERVGSCCGREPGRTGWAPGSRPAARDHGLSVGAPRTVQRVAAEEPGDILAAGPCFTSERVRQTERGAQRKGRHHVWLSSCVSKRTRSDFFEVKKMFK